MQRHALRACDLRLRRRRTRSPRNPLRKPQCMQVVGVNSADKKHVFEKYLREAAIFPIYDGGNFVMQRRRVHGVLASPDFNPRALMDNEYVEFTKQMETIDTIQHTEAPQQPLEMA